MLKENQIVAYDIGILKPPKLVAGEGLIWDYRHQVLRWVDYAQQLLMGYEPETQQFTHQALPVATYSIALCNQEQLILAGTQGLYVWHVATNKTVALATHYHQQPLAFNDIVVDAYGRIYAGTINEDEERLIEAGKLYLIEPQRIAIMDENIGYSNGIALSPDGQRLFLTDSLTRTIYTYRIHIKSGKLYDKQTLVTVSKEEGVPDGLTVDSQGRLWSSQWFGAKIVAYDAVTANPLYIIHLPHPHIASLAFAENTLTELYALSSNMTWTAGEFLAPTGYKGLPNSNSASLFRVHFAAEVAICGCQDHMLIHTTRYCH